MCELSGKGTDATPKKRRYDRLTIATADSTMVVANAASAVAVAAVAACAVADASAAELCPADEAALTAIL